MTSRRACGAQRPGAASSHRCSAAPFAASRHALRPRRGAVEVAAILSGGPQQPVSGPIPPQPIAPPQPAAAPHRDAVVVHATDSSSDAVPLPEQPEPSPTRLSAIARVLDGIIDRSVRAPAQAYSRALKTRPLLTKACTSLVGFVLGDLIAQHFSHPGVVDVWRAARLGAYGLLIDGPVGATWYDVLERHVFPAAPSSTKAVLAKTALDQVVYATVMTAVYFAVIKSLEGHPELILATLQSKFVPTLAANYLIWPLAHLINFRFVPSDYRILYNNVVCVAWLTYLSLLTHTKFNLLSLLHFH